MDINAAFPSKYLKAADLQGREFNLTINQIVMEDLGDGEIKPVVYFGGAQKGLVLNRTNADAITILHGPETDAWQGRQITLTTAWVAFQGRNVQAIRVKLPQGGTQPAQAVASNAAPTNGGLPAGSATGVQMLGNPDPNAPVQDDTPFDDSPPF